MDLDLSVNTPAFSNSVNMSDTEIPSGFQTPMTNYTDNKLEMVDEFEHPTEEEFYAVKL